MISLMVFILACAAAAAPGLYFRPGRWYRKLAKPFWCPPNWLFGPVWSLLYASIAYSGWRVWQRADIEDLPAAVIIYGIQLILNGLWSTVFFGLRRPGLAFVEIVFLWLSILATIVVFHRADAFAAYLLIPYAVWVGFAVALNFSIWRRNRESTAF
jgi:tryptophan-rich sensory protein